MFTIEEPLAECLNVKDVGRKEGRKGGRKEGRKEGGKERRMECIHE